MLKKRDSYFYIHQIIWWPVFPPDTVGTGNLERTDCMKNVLSQDKCESSEQLYTDLK